MSTARYTQAQRDEAIALYIARGGKYAESESGIKANTIRQWARRAGVPLSRERRAALSDETAQASEEWALRRIRLADRFGEVAEQALEAASESVKEDYSADAGNYARTAALLVDRAQLLSGSATSRVENVETLRNEGDAVLRELEDAMRGPQR